MTLKVLRDGVSLTFVLTREKVKYDLVSSKKLGSNAFYIQVNSFGEGVSEEFTKAVDAMKKDGATRLILDLRNDPGGNVYEVSNMLDYFVPKGKSKLNIASLSNLESYYSEGKDAWFADKKVVVLINEGTASASEIMAGTMADYLESRIKIVGEKSYGKGSVQIVAPNADGSSLKYTVAKWFTGKHSRSIDHIGISPDIEVVYDEALWKSSKVDNQLEKALSIQF